MNAKGQKGKEKLLLKKKKRQKRYITRIVSVSILVIFQDQLMKNRHM